MSPALAASHAIMTALATQAGITAPIVPGIMPITNVAQIERMTVMCGARIPGDLRARLEGWEDDGE